MVDGAGDKFFACAAFAGDQDGRAGLADAMGQGEEPAHGRRGNDTGHAEVIGVAGDRRPGSGDRGEARRGAAEAFQIEREGRHIVTSFESILHSGMNLFYFGLTHCYVNNNLGELRGRTFGGAVTGRGNAPNRHETYQSCHAKCAALSPGRLNRLI